MEHFVSASLCRGSPEDTQNELARALQQQQLSVQELINGFDSALSEAEVLKRADICEILVKVVEDVFSATICPADCLALAHLFVRWLHDWSCLSGGLHGCIIIVEAIPKEEEAYKATLFMIVDAFFDSIQVRSLKQSQRLRSLSLLERLIKKHGEEIHQQRFKENLIERVIAAVDGEKDPRCLVSVFRVVHCVVDLYRNDSLLEESAEDLFDVVACYFPITDTEDFEMDGHVVVKKEDLEKMLNVTITYTEVFAGHCLPLLLEKLTSSHRGAKLSALRCLQCSLLKFSLNVFCDFVRPLWQEMRQCIFPNALSEDEELKTAAIETTVSLCSLKPVEGLDCESFSDVIFNESRLLDLLPRLKAASSNGNCAGALLQSNPAVQLLKSVSWVNSGTAGKALEKILKPLLADLSDVSMSAASPESTPDASKLPSVEPYMQVFHEVAHVLSSKLKSGESKVQDSALCFEQITEFLAEIHRVMEDQRSNAIPDMSMGAQENQWLLEMDLLQLQAYFAIMTDQEWSTELQQLLEKLMKWNAARRLTHESDQTESETSMTLSETFQSTLITILQWMLDSGDSTERSALLCQKVLSIAVHTLLPADGASMQSFQVLQMEKDLRFRLLSTLVLGSDNRRQFLLTHIGDHLSEWLSQSVSSLGKQKCLASVLQFLRKELLVPATTDAKGTVSQYLDILCDFLPLLESYSDQHASSSRGDEGCKPSSEIKEPHEVSFLTEMVQLLRSLTRGATDEKQEDVWRRISAQKKHDGEANLWRCVIFCGIEDLTKIFPVQKDAMDFFSACFQNIQRIHDHHQPEMQTLAYRTLASAGFHLIHLMKDSDSIVETTLPQLKEALILPSPKEESAIRGAVVFSCYCLRAILSSKCSYETCKNAVECILLPLASILNDAQEESNDHQTQTQMVAGVAAGNGIQFLIAEDPMECSDLFSLLEDNSKQIASLRLQRGFSVCLNVLLHCLETKTTFVGSLLSLGFLIRGANPMFLKIENKRTLPWILTLIEMLHAKSEPILHDHHRLLVSTIHALYTLIKEPRSYDPTTTNGGIKHEIMRTIMHATDFLQHSDVRCTAVRCLVSAFQSVLSEDDRQSYRSRVLDLLTTALDDPKRKVRQLAVKARQMIMLLQKSEK